MIKVHKSHFKLYTYYDVLSHSVVINKSQIHPYLYLELPRNISKFLSLYDVCEICKSNTSESVDYVDMILRDNKRPWLQVNTDFLNLTVGYHIYRFSFIDTSVDDTILLYFAYNIQDDNPEKSYIYMHID